MFILQDENGAKTHDYPQCQKKMKITTGKNAFLTLMIRHLLISNLVAWLLRFADLITGTPCNLLFSPVEPKLYDLYLRWIEGNFINFSLGRCSVESCSLGQRRNWWKLCFFLFLFIVFFDPEESMELQHWCSFRWKTTVKWSCGLPLNPPRDFSEFKHY